MIQRYTLPDLPYDYAALEPHYSARVLELHHGKHHAAYVAGANTTLETLAEAREKRDFGLRLSVYSASGRSDVARKRWHAHGRPSAPDLARSIPRREGWP